MSHTTLAQPAALVKPRPWTPYIAIGVALFAFSLGAIWIRLAQGEGVPSLFIAGFRLTGATLFFTPFVIRRYGGLFRRLSRRDWLTVVTAGILNASHFILTFLALENTTVMMNEVLGGTSMLWVALLEALAFKMRHGRQVWLGIALALAGGGVMGLAGSGSGATGRNPALGGLLAAVSAMAFAAYLITGRKLRANIPVLPYVWLVYGFAALTTLVMMVLTRTPITGYSVDGYFWTVVLTIALQIVAHSGYNYALGYVSATLLVVLGQIPVIASAVAGSIVFREIPAPFQILGSIAIVGGVVLVSLGQSRRR